MHQPYNRDKASETARSRYSAASRWATSRSVALSAAQPYRVGVIRWLVGAGLAVMILSGLLWTAPRWLVPLIAERSPRCLYAVATTEKHVALTIDDGPDPASTAEILRVLGEHEASATFFLISDNIAGAEAIVHDLTARGHELGNHLTRDEPSIRLAPEAFVEALGEAHESITRFGTVRWLRPGGGLYDDAMLETIHRHGYRCALGSVYPYDGHVTSPRLAAAYVLANVRPGAVIVLHDGEGRGARTVAILERVLPELRKRGYRVTTLSELVDTRSHVVR